MPLPCVLVLTMARRQPTMVRLDPDLADAVNEVLYGRRRVVLLKHGRRVVAMIWVADLSRLDALEDRVEGALAEDALAERDRIPLEEVRRRRRKRRGRKK